MVLDTLLEMLDYVLDVDAKLVAGVELQGAVNEATRWAWLSTDWPAAPSPGTMPYPQRRQGQRQRGLMPPASPSCMNVRTTVAGTFSVCPSSCIPYSSKISATATWSSLASGKGREC